MVLWQKLPFLPEVPPTWLRTTQYRVVTPRSAQFRPVPFDTTWYCPVPSDIAQYRLILPSAT